MPAPRAAASMALRNGSWSPPATASSSKGTTGSHRERPASSMSASRNSVLIKIAHSQASWPASGHPISCSECTAAPRWASRCVGRLCYRSRTAREACMHVTLLGTMGWMPSDRRETTSFLCLDERSLFILDAGTGLRRLLEAPQAALARGPRRGPSLPHALPPRPRVRAGVPARRASRAPPRDPCRSGGRDRSRPRGRRRRPLAQAVQPARLEGPREHPRGGPRCRHQRGRRAHSPRACATAHRYERRVPLRRRARAGHGHARRPRHRGVRRRGQAPAPRGLVQRRRPADRTRRRRSCARATPRTARRPPWHGSPPPPTSGASSSCTSTRCTTRPTTSALRLRLARSSRATELHPDGTVLDTAAV